MGDVSRFRSVKQAISYCGLCPSNIPYSPTGSTAPPGFSIDATTGKVTWDTTKIHTGFGLSCGFAAPKAGDFWAEQVIVEAHDKSTNALVSSVPVDLMMQFVNPVGVLPTISLNPTGPQNITSGNPVSFSATGNSANPGAKVTLNATGVPVGANATNLNQALTPPVTSNFTWTPAIGQEGTYVITYTVTDDNFQQVSASETIVVAANPPTASCTVDFSLPYGQAATVSASVFDPNNELLDVVFAVDGQTVQTFNGVVAYPTHATESINQTYGAVGPHVVSVKATDPHGVNGSCQTTVTVVKADQTITFAALPDVTYGNPDFNLAATAASGLNVDFAASGSCTVNGNTVHITGAGACTITASQGGDTNYNAAPSVPRTFNITKAPLTVTAGSYSGVYDGAAHPLSACAVSANFDNLTCTNSPAGPVGPDVGGAAVTPVINGDTSSYNVSTNNGAWSITPLGVTITAGGYSGVYDGAAHSPSACGSSYPGVTCTNNPASVGPDVGSGAVAPVAAYPSGIPADYNIVLTNGTWSITALTVKLSAGSYTGVYDGSGHTPSACTSTFAGITCSNNPVAVGPDVSTGAIAPVASYGSAPPSDFIIVPVNGSWSITQLTVIITAGSYSGAFDGSAHAVPACSSTYQGVTCVDNPSSVGPGVGSGAVAPVATIGSGIPGDYNLLPTSGSWSITQVASTVTITCPSSVIYTGKAQTPCTAKVTGAGGLNQSVTVTYQNNIVGTATATANYAGDANHTGSSATKTFTILYSGSCLAGPGHIILPPINPDGSSVWKQGSTVPAKFRACDSAGNSVGSAGTVSDFKLIQINGGTVTDVDEDPDGTNGDIAFRWTGDQWIFNISTKPLYAGYTYVYQITLNDGSIIQFQYGLK